MVFFKNIVDVFVQNWLLLELVVTHTPIIFVINVFIHSFLLFYWKKLKYPFTSVLPISSVSDMIIKEEEKQIVCATIGCDENQIFTVWFGWLTRLFDFLVEWLYLNKDMFYMKEKETKISNRRGCFVLLTIYTILWELLAQLFCI